MAWELVELAWDEDGENWFGETLNGGPFNLEEPPDDVIWTRDDFDLPPTGVLRLQYRTTLRVAKYKDVLDQSMLQSLLVLMTHKSVTDSGLRLLKLAAIEFFFTATMVGDLIALMKDSVARAEVACSLLPRVVDPVNLTNQVGERLPARFMCVCVCVCVCVPSV